MKPISLTGFALCLTLSLAAQDRQEFRNPSAHYRPKPLWFWNDTRITREGIDEQMAGFVRRCGYGGFSILPFGPRLAPAYLSGDYFELYRHTARKAAELLQTHDPLTVLLWLMAHTEDTNLYHRGGAEGAAFVKEQAAAILAAPPEQRAALTQALDDALIECRLSPGGSADLLALALLLNSSSTVFPSFDR